MADSSLDRGLDDPHEDRVLAELHQKERYESGARKTVDTRNERGTGNQPGNKINKK